MRTGWCFGIPEGAEGKDPVASMGKLLSSLLKLNILEGLLSISAGELVEGEACWGLSGGPGGSHFPKNSHRLGMTVRVAGERRAPWGGLLNLQSLLFLSPFGSHFAHGGSS